MLIYVRNEVSCLVTLVWIKCDIVADVSALNGIKSAGIDTYCHDHLLVQIQNENKQLIRSCGGNCLCKQALPEQSREKLT